MKKLVCYLAVALTLTGCMVARTDVTTFPGGSICTAEIKTLFKSSEGLSIEACGMSGSAAQTAVDTRLAGIIARTLFMQAVLPTALPLIHSLAR